MPSESVMDLKQLLENDMSSEATVTFEKKNNKFNSPFDMVLDDDSK